MVVEQVKADELTKILLCCAAGMSTSLELTVVVLWSCGLHGSNIMDGVMAPIWYGAMDQNRLTF